MTISLSELLQRKPDADTLTLWLEKIPYAVYLGIRAEIGGNDILFVLPADRNSSATRPCRRYMAG